MHSCLDISCKEQWTFKNNWYLQISLAAKADNFFFFFFFFSGKELFFANMQLQQIFKILG